MSMNSGAFPRIDDRRPVTGRQVTAASLGLLAAVRRPCEATAAWVEAARQRRAARRAARDEERRMEWWRSQ